MSLSEVLSIATCSGCRFVAVVAVVVVIVSCCSLSYSVNTNAARNTKPLRVHNTASSTTRTAGALSAETTSGWVGGQSPFTMMDTNLQCKLLLLLCGISHSSSNGPRQHHRRRRRRCRHHHPAMSTKASNPESLGEHPVAGSGSRVWVSYNIVRAVSGHESNHYTACEHDILWYHIRYVALFLLVANNCKWSGSNTTNVHWIYCDAIAHEFTAELISPRNDLRLFGDRKLMGICSLEKLIST